MSGEVLWGGASEGVRTRVRTPSVTVFGSIGAAASAADPPFVLRLRAASADLLLEGAARVRDDRVRSHASRSHRAPPRTTRAARRVMVARPPAGPAERQVERHVYFVATPERTPPPGTPLWSHCAVERRSDRASAADEGAAGAGGVQRGVVQARRRPRRALPPSTCSRCGSLATRGIGPQAGYRTDGRRVWSGRLEDGIATECELHGHSRMP